jgi:hypothetical protein
MQNAPWIHIEYAAGNYGNSVVFGNLFRRSNYDILHKTLELLVQERGPKGIFYVNDLIEPWAQLAAVSLHKFAVARGWSAVEIRVLSGDICQIELPHSDTAHLKNPRLGLIYLDGTHPFFTKAANRSRSGLEITTHYPKVLIAQSNIGGWSLHSLGTGERYRFPSGRKRRLPTERFSLSPEVPISAGQVQATAQRPLGRAWSTYQAPVPTWKKTLGDMWHALLVTLGIRRQ